MRATAAGHGRSDRAHHPKSSGGPLTNRPAPRQHIECLRHRYRGSKRHNCLHGCFSSEVRVGEPKYDWAAGNLPFTRGAYGSLVTVRPRMCYGRTRIRRSQWPSRIRNTPGAAELASSALRDPQDRRRFVSRVRSALADDIERAGEAAASRPRATLAGCGCAARMAGVTPGR